MRKYIFVQNAKEASLAATQLLHFSRRTRTIERYCTATTVKNRSNCVWLFVVVVVVVVAGTVVNLETAVETMSEVIRGAETCPAWAPA